MSKYKVCSVSISLDSSSDYVKDIRALWHDTCNGTIELWTDDQTRVYGIMEYDYDNRPKVYSLQVLATDDIDVITNGQYTKVCAISTVSSEDAADKAWELVDAVRNRDYFGDIEHFIEEDGTYTCEVFVSVVGDIEEV